MKKISTWIAILLATLHTGCVNYLDVVPDNIPVMDHAFSSKNTAEKFLFTCYSYLPNVATLNTTITFLGGDECWVYTKGTGFIEQRIGGTMAWEIGRGAQNTNDPYMNYWDGEQGGKNLFMAIRDCNIFFENIDKPKDLPTAERKKWIAEVTFLKAYYHFFLMQLYGPIPIVDVNLPMSASPEEVRVFREPVEKVVEYIVGQLDKAALDLPLEIVNTGSELGRITKPMALSLKAKTLAFIASPLMNGNRDYAHIVDKRGEHLFPQEYSVERWKAAAKAAKEAIDCAHEAGHMLFRYIPTDRKNPESPELCLEMNIRDAVCQRWNQEIIWGSVQGTGTLQRMAHPRFPASNFDATSILSPTMKIAEQFYSSNGVPIEDDITWKANGDYEKRFSVRKASAADIERIVPGYETAVLNFNREPRFYGTLGFDGGQWYNQKTPKVHLEGKRSQYSGFITVEDYSITGYFAKKVCSIQTESNNSSLKTENYSFPLIRLADMYLLYAEALNEAQDAPNSAVYEFLDSVRMRSGLKGVVESWNLYTDRGGITADKNEMRKIIQRERMIELALEGQRFWDLRRWKLAERYFSEPINGWNVRGEETPLYYQVTRIWKRNFLPKEYLWPLKIYTLLQNPNLVQNPGWN